MRSLWIIISKITLSETLAKHILFTSDRYSKLNVQDYIIFLQYELNIHLFYQELQIKTNRSKTYTDIPYRNWTWQHSERSSFIIRKHNYKNRKGKGRWKEEKIFCKFTNNTNIKHENLGYKHSHPYKICDFQKNCHLHVSKKNPKTIKTDRMRQRLWNRRIERSRPTVPRNTSFAFWGSNFFNSETTTQSAWLCSIYIDSHG